MPGWGAPNGREPPAMLAKDAAAWLNMGKLEIQNLRCPDPRKNRTNLQLLRHLLNHAPDSRDLRACAGRVPEVACTSTAVWAVLYFYGTLLFERPIVMLVLPLHKIIQETQPPDIK